MLIHLILPKLNSPQNNVKCPKVSIKILEESIRSKYGRLNIFRTLRHTLKIKKTK